jgi:hypothetical protein
MTEFEAANWLLLAGFVLGAPSIALQGKGVPLLLQALAGIGVCLVFMSGGLYMLSILKALLI